MEEINKSHNPQISLSLDIGTKFIGWSLTVTNNSNNLAQSLIPVQHIAGVYKPNIALDKNGNHQNQNRVKALAQRNLLNKKKKRCITLINFLQSKGYKGGVSVEKSHNTLKAIETVCSTVASKEELFTYFLSIAKHRGFKSNAENYEALVEQFKKQLIESYGENFTEHFSEKEKKHYDKLKDAKKEDSNLQKKGNNLTPKLQSENLTISQFLAQTKLQNINKVVSERTLVQFSGKKDEARLYLTDYTPLREHYINEFKKVQEIQSTYHPNLNNEDWQEIYNIIFTQEPLQERNKKDWKDSEVNYKFIDNNLIQIDKRGKVLLPYYGKILFQNENGEPNPYDGTPQAKEKREHLLKIQENLGTNKNLINELKYGKCLSPEAHTLVNSLIKLVGELITAIRCGYFAKQYNLEAIPNFSLFKDIFVENASDENNEDRKFAIFMKNMQNKKLNLLAKELNAKYGGSKKFTKDSQTRLRLFIEQLDEKDNNFAVCPYTGDNFSLSDVFNNVVEVDHILTSKLGNKFENLALVKQNANRNKGNNTACDYLGKEKLENLKELHERLYKKSSAKFQIIRTIKNKDIASIKDAKSIKHNKKLKKLFSDTSLQALWNVIKLSSEYFKGLSENTYVNEQLNKESIQSITGRNNAINRKLIGLDKNRENLTNHAQDAILVYYGCINKIFNNEKKDRLGNYELKYNHNGKEFAPIELEHGADNSEGKKFETAGFFNLDDFDSEIKKIEYSLKKAMVTQAYDHRTTGALTADQATKATKATDNIKKVIRKHDGKELIHRRKIEGYSYVNVWCSDDDKNKKYKGAYITYINNKKIEELKTRVLNSEETKQLIKLLGQPELTAKLITKLYTKDTLILEKTGTKGEIESGVYQIHILSATDNKIYLKKINENKKEKNISINVLFNNYKVLKRKSKFITL